MKMNGYVAEKWLAEKLHARRVTLSERKSYDIEREDMIGEVKTAQYRTRYARFIRANYWLSYGFAMAMNIDYYFFLVKEVESGIRVYATNAFEFEEIFRQKKPIIYISVRLLSKNQLPINI